MASRKGESVTKAFAGKVTLVMGAIRGIGKSIAQSLGEAVAIVYVTGRTEHSQEATVPLPGTIHETAQSVTELGRGLESQSAVTTVRMMKLNFFSILSKVSTISSKSWSIMSEVVIKQFNMVNLDFNQPSGKCHHHFGTRCMWLVEGHITFAASLPPG